MKSIVRITGLCLIGGSCAGYFVSLTAGICAALFVAGAGLFIDSMR